MSNLTVNQRLKVFLTSEEYSNENLRVALGVKTRQQVSNWLTSREKMPEKHILTVVKMFQNLNSRWLITGEGSMLNNQEQPLSVIEEKKGTYGQCMSCVKKDAKIEVITEKLQEQEKKNDQLHEKIGELKNEIENLDGSSNGNGTKQATG